MRGEGTETMTIVLNYTTEDCAQEQVEFEDDVTTVNLESKGIRSIDLTPLLCTILPNVWESVCTLGSSYKFKKRC